MTLLDTVQRKNRYFRIAELTFVVLVAIGIFVIIGTQMITLGRIRDQLDAQTALSAQQQALGAERTRQINTLTRHLDCIVIFFQQTGRQNLTIDDINKCTISGNGTPQQFFDNDSGVAAPQTTTPSASTPSKTPTKSTPKPTPQEPTPPAEQPPARILGIPVCVPLLDICVR